jgi:hypothetical protein
MVRVKSPQDLGASVVFILIGVAGLYFGSELTFGSAARMGPGYFPMIISGLIVGLGLIVAWRALRIEGPPIETVRVRPIVFIVAAIVASGYLINAVGLALSTLAITLIAAYARRDVNLRETLVLGLVLGLFAVAVFVYGLKQPLPPWWGR